jgi:prepilin-type N-terminal cleavage/methylation domain-containing protein
MKLNRHRPSRGFSLPELIVVVSIIAVLATMLIIWLAHERDNALAATCVSNERRISEALESYAVDHSGQYPQSSGNVDAALFGGEGNPYMSRNDLVDPADGLPYQYIAGPGTCQNPDAEYQIIDQGGHSSTSLIALLQADDGQDAIAFCSDRGVYAIASSAAGAASILKP